MFLRSLQRILPCILLMIVCVRAAYAVQLERIELLSNPNQIKSMLKQGSLYPIDVPNPHWRPGMCIACHEQSSAFSRSSLRTLNIAEMCGYCHNEYSKAIFMHPTNKMISDDMWRKIPDSFQRSLLTLGSSASRLMNCLSCHDLKIQCLENRSVEKISNPLFMRNGPFKNRIEQCFFCHDETKFQRFNPHKQIVNGKLNRESCKSCHADTDNLDSNTKAVDVRYVTDKDLSQLCVNCHPSKPHPGGDLGFIKKKKADHLVVPKASTKAYMEKMRKVIDVEFPVMSSSGKLHCATCHNPHQKGVIGFKAADTGADLEHRLRMKKPCRFCHDN